MHRYGRLVMVLAVLLLGAAGIASVSAQEGYSSIVEEGITLRWKVNGANLDVILRAPTDGWVSVGFKPGMRMKDANYIIGFVDNGGGIHIRDDYGTSPMAHKSDEALGGKSDILNPSGIRQGKNTELRFSIPLDSGDKYDQPLKPGERIPVILAYGPASGDGFSAYHTKRAKAQIKL